MDFQQLEVLEDKIKKILVSMRALQAENDHLNRKYDDSQKAITKLKQDLEKWAKSAEENDALREQMDLLRKERDEIKNKIERLIGHLEELELKI